MPRDAVCSRVFYCISPILFKLAADLGEVKLLEMVASKASLPSLRSSSPHSVAVSPSCLCLVTLANATHLVWQGGTEHWRAMACSLPHTQVGLCSQPGPAAAFPRAALHSALLRRVPLAARSGPHHTHLSTLCFSPVGVGFAVTDLRCSCLSGTLPSEAQPLSHLLGGLIFTLRNPLPV